MPSGGSGSRIARKFFSSTRLELVMFPYFLVARRQMPHREESVRCVCGEDPPRTASHRRVTIFAIASVAVVYAVVALSAAPGAAPWEAISLLSTGRTARTSSLEYFGTQHAMHSTQRHTHIHMHTHTCMQTYIPTDRRADIFPPIHSDGHIPSIHPYVHTFIHIYIPT